jgi:FkbM family methyltransferase
MKTKVVVFGLGMHYEQWKGYLSDDYEIVALADNKTNAKQPGAISPARIASLDCDYVLVTPGLFYEMVNQLVFELRIPAEKVKKIYYGGVLQRKLADISVLESGGAKTITASYDGLRVILESDYTAVIFEESLMRGYYGVNPPPDWKYRVIDIGANVGIASIFFAKNKLVETVHAFEPFPQNCEAMMKNLELNPDLASKINVTRAGVGRIGENKLFDNGISWAANGTGVTEVKILGAVEALRPILSSAPEKTKIILKMDCERAEYEIVPELIRSGLLRSIDVILMEWHGLQKARRLCDTFAENGFYVFFDSESDSPWEAGSMKAVRLCG